MTDSTLELYGMLMSPYSMKMRAYLRYRRIPFNWRTGLIANHIAETKVQTYMMPVIGYPDGTFENDSTPIIDQLKDKKRSKVLPGPRPAMWSGPDQVMILRERHGEKAFFKMVQASMIDFMMAAYNWIKVVPAEGPDAIDKRVKAMLEGEINADEGISLIP